MAHLEKHKMSHLDIKPQNCLSANAELTHFLIGDMGLSHKTQTTLTHFSKNPVGGTTAYMAPEILCEENYGSPADVYSACVLFVEVIIGQRLPVPPCSERCPPFLVDVIQDSFSASPSKPTDRPKFSTIVQLHDKYEAMCLIQDRDKLAKLRENLLIARESDSSTYTAIWQKMTNDNMASSKTLSSAIKKLTKTVAKSETPLQSADIDSIESLRAVAGVVEKKLHDFGKHIAVQCSDSTTGVMYKAGPIKTAQRIQEKMQNDYDGNVRCIIDAARGSVVFQTLAQLTTGIQILLKGGEGAPQIG